MSGSRVALLFCDRYEPGRLLAALRRGLELLGGVRRFVRPGERLLVKPNILAGYPPERAVTTHPALVQAALALLLEAGARPSWGDSSGIVDPAEAARNGGYVTAARALGVERAEFEAARFVSFSRGGRRHRFPLAEAVCAADGLFNLAKMKTHQLTRLTGAVKNLFGCVPGYRKPRLHLRYPDAAAFSRMLVDLNLLLRPRLHLLDGILAMEGNGPRNGDPVPMNALVLSEDPVAADAAFCRLIGLDPAFVPTCVAGRELGLGTWREEEIELLGDPLPELARPSFQVTRYRVPDDALLRYFPAVKNRLLPRPVIDGARCRRCGACIDACPVPGGRDLPRKAIRFPQKGSPPVYDYDRCIRCFCCQESCPHRAIGTEVPFLGRLLFAGRPRRATRHGRF